MESNTPDLTKSSAKIENSTPRMRCRPLYAILLPIVVATQGQESEESARCPTALRCSTHGHGLDVTGSGGPLAGKACMYPTPIPNADYKDPNAVASDCIRVSAQGHSKLTHSSAFLNNPTPIRQIQRRFDPTPIFGIEGPLGICICICICVYVYVYMNICIYVYMCIRV